MTESKGENLLPPEVLSQLGQRKSVRIALIKEHKGDPKVLLTTEQKGIIYHSLPGGKVDPIEYNDTTSIGDAFAAALARELEEELGLPQKQFFQHVIGLTQYFDFAILTKFNKEDPLNEVVFYSLLSDEVLEKLNLEIQFDAKIVDYNWVSLKEILGNFRIEDQKQLPPQGVFIFVDSHIPGILEKLYRKFSNE